MAVVLNKPREKQTYIISPEYMTKLREEAFDGLRKIGNLGCWMRQDKQTIALANGGYRHEPGGDRIAQLRLLLVPGDAQRDLLCTIRCSHACDRSLDSLTARLLWNISEHLAWPTYCETLWFSAKVVEEDAA